MARCLISVGRGWKVRVLVTTSNEAEGKGRASAWACPISTSTRVGGCSCWQAPEYVGQHRPQPGAHQGRELWSGSTARRSHTPHPAPAHRSGCGLVLRPALAGRSLSQPPQVTRQRRGQEIFAQSWNRLIAHTYISLF